MVGHGWSHDTSSREDMRVVCMHGDAEKKRLSYGVGVQQFYVVFTGNYGIIFDKRVLLNA